MKHRSRQRDDRPRFRDEKPKDRRLQPTIESMLFLLKKADIKLNRDQVSQLWRYHNLIRSRNQDRDLTRIIGFEPMIIKHYIDSMVVGKYFNFPSPIVDIGTGAGFPGIPLKIRYPHLKMILAEHRPKRIAFLKEAIEELGLRNIEVFEHKVVSQSFQTPVKGVVTRALEEIEKTVLRTSAALEDGGYLIFLKGPAVDPEIEQAKRRFGDSLKLVMHQKFHLPVAGHERRLVIFQKVGDVLQSEHA